MKIISALKNWFRKQDETAANALKDPVAEGRFAIEDAKEQVREFRGAIASALAQVKNLEKQKEVALSEAAKYGRIADVADKAGNEADAIKSLEVKVQSEKRANSLSQEIKTSTDMIAKLRDQLTRAEAKIVNADNNQKILAARMEGAKAREGLAKASSGFSDSGNPLSALDNLESAVNEQESKAEAYEELSGAGQPSLEEKYSGNSTAVQDELAKLRAGRKPVAA
jgi:phage shock protein A